MAIRELREEPFAPRRAQLRAALRVVVEAQDFVEQFVAIRGVYDEARDAVLDNLLGRARRADARFAGAHRLEEYKAEAFIAARHHEEAALRIQRGERNVADAARERHRP